MSESLKHSGEQNRDSLDLSAETKNNLERLKEKAEKAAEASPDQVQEIKSAVETQAISGKEFTVGEKESSSHGHQHISQKKLKSDAYKKSMKQVRRKLSKPDRAFSKVIHSKAVESVSDISSTTIARPSGILGGGICALAGSSFLLFMSKTYGFKYNYFIFFVFFVGGFFVGMIGELIFRQFKRRA